MKAKYIILSDNLKKLIITNIENGINHLPPERKLCEIYGVSRQTVRNALATLENDNIIKRIPGSGAYITGILPGVLSNNICLLISNDHEYTYPDFIARLENSFSENGYNLKTYVTDNSSTLERTILKELNNNLPRAILAEPINSHMPSINSDIYKKISAMDVPLVFFNNRYSNLSDVVCVKNDDFAGSYQLTKYLISLSHKNILGIFQSDSSSGIDKYLGFTHAMLESDISFSDKNICFYNCNDLDVLRKKNDTGFIVDYIKKALPSCSAVVCQNDEIAYWLIKELNHTNIVVPSDISVVSFDNSYLATLSKNRITTMESSSPLTTELVNVTLEIIKGRNVFPSPIPWNLIKGQTSTSI